MAMERSSRVSLASYNAIQAANLYTYDVRQPPLASKRDVFTDIGFPPAEVENLRIRSAMMRALISFLRDSSLTPAKAAKMLHSPQSRVDELIRGDIHLFSIDDLVSMLAAAGLRVDLKVKKAA